MHSTSMFGSGSQCESADQHVLRSLRQVHVKREPPDGCRSAPPSARHEPGSSSPSSRRATWCPMAVKTRRCGCDASSGARRLRTAEVERPGLVLLRCSCHTRLVAQDEFADQLRAGVGSHPEELTAVEHPAEV